jgi:hypothetical protein
MPNSLYLEQAHHVLSAPIVGWNAQLIDSIPPGMKLIASIESGPSQMTGRSQGTTATSLEVAMSQETATEFYKQLGVFLGAMGWLPKT